MIMEVPVNPLPAQKLERVINGQRCSIRLVWRHEKLFCDLSVNNEPIWLGLVIHNCTPFKNFRVTDFVGNLAFIDYEGANDPHYSGLGSRYRLFYFTDDVQLPESFQVRGTEV
jgi:hypothetical protein